MSDPRISGAYWIEPSTGLVLLSRDWSSEDLPPISLSGHGSLSELSLADPELFGGLSGYYVKDGALCFILPSGTESYIDPNSDKIYVAGDFNGWDDAIGKNDWQMHWDHERQTHFLWLDTTIIDLLDGEPSARFKFVTDNKHWISVHSLAPNAVFNESGISDYQLNSDKTGAHCFIFNVENKRLIASEQLLIFSDGEHEETHEIVPGLYFYQLQSNQELGAIVSKNTTAFRLFAPRATSAKVEFFKTLDRSDAQTIDMHICDDGLVWEAVHPENLDRTYYFYHVDGKSDCSAHFEPNFDILDPYAKACVSHIGPGIILSSESLPPKINNLYEPPCWHDLVIMEAHVRDLVENAPTNEDASDQIGFKGLAKWIRNEEFYISHMGVNAVELQPIQQFDSATSEEYHWGYMTTNFFSPSAWYATNPEKASQLAEFRDTVDAFHERGIAVILDVVYNHVGEPPFLLYIDKEYYFDIDVHGNLVNWSGCGNTLRAQAAMSKKLIIDSLIHLVEHYDIDGFRFDLAELLGIEVLSEIEERLKQIKPGIILIAEPWSFRGHIAHDLKHTGYAFWNDGYRDFLPSYLMGNGDARGIQYYMSACTGHATRFPAQTVNYVESHDDFCWIDRITQISNNNGTNPTDDDIQRTHLMFAVLMCSAGIPMFSQGQDMLRSKHGHHNTYLRGDINALDYSRSRKHKHTHEYFKAWIGLRNSEMGSVFRLDGPPSDSYFRFFESHDLSAAAIIFNADLSQENRSLLFVINPHIDETAVISMNENDAGTWHLIADENRVDNNGIEDNRLNDNILTMPPLSCGLWLSN